MANTLLITKLSDGSFSFVVNGDVANVIINLRNDMTNVANEVHFKTSEGANLIKLQQILYNEVTIVDGSPLAVATSPLDLRIKLRSVGFWDWMDAGSGSGVDRFDDLLDTFNYFGNDRKVPMVDESQSKLIPYTIPDTSYLNLFPTPLVADKGIKTNSLGTAYEFYDIVNLVTQFIRLGYTATSPSEDVMYQALALKSDVSDLSLKEDKANKNIVSGYSGLDITGKNYISKIPNNGGNTGQIAHRNLTEYTTYTDGFSVNVTTGALIANAAFTSTDHISINPDVKYYYLQKTGGHTTIFGAWYDINNVFISGINVPATTKIIQPPINAYKVRISYLGVGTDAPLNFYLYQTLKLSSYGDSITAMNTWQPTVANSLSLVSFVNGFAGYNVSGATGLNQDSQVNTIASDSDIILMLGGTNDWANNVVLGSATSQDINEFYGALNVTYRKLKTNHPTAKIVALATTYGELPGRVGFTDSGRVNTLGLTSTDYANAVIIAAKNNNIRFINTQNVWDKENVSIFTTFDGGYIHPNATGGVELGTKIALDLVQDVLFLKSTANSLNSTALLKIGNQVFNGVKSATNTTASQIAGIALFNSGSGGSQALSVTVNAASNAIGARFINNSTTTGSAIVVNNLAAGVGINGTNTSTGVFGKVDASSGSTSDLWQFTKNTVLTTKVDHNGVITTPNIVLTGTPTAPTATAGTNTTQLATTAFVTATRPYKVYTAIISQTGTSDPTVLVLENTLGGTVVWARSATGLYSGTLAGVFTASKTWIMLGNNSNVNNDLLVQASRGDNNFVNLTSRLNISATDGIITDLHMEIRVYL